MRPTRSRPSSRRPGPLSRSSSTRGGGAAGLACGPTQTRQADGGGGHPDRMVRMDKASCTLPFTPIRAKPDDSSEQVTQALFADPLEVLAQNNGWAEVTVAD